MSEDNKRFGIDNKAFQAFALRHKLETDPEFALKLLDVLSEERMRISPVAQRPERVIEEISLRSVAPFLTRKRDGRIFAELAHKICEETQNDKGCAISEVTRVLYRKLLKCFLNTASFYEESEDKNHQEIQCIKDEVRTIIMMRAISRFIKHAKTEKEGSIDVIEAGSGSGLLAATAAVLDPAVRVVAYDVRKKVVECSKIRVNRLGLSDRVDVEQRDLLKSPIHGAADCVIAEHISPGLLTEQTAEIPRSFMQVNPDRFIPYSVKPYLVLGMKLRNIVSGGIVVDPPSKDDHLRFLRGEEIVLADSFQDDTVFIDTREQIPVSPGVNHILVGTDVRWLSPEFDDENDFYESFEDRIRSGVSSSSDISHVVKPTVIGKEGDKSCIVISNIETNVSETRLQLSYKMGVLRKSIESPIDVVSTNPAVVIGEVEFIDE